MARAHTAMPGDVREVSLAALVREGEAQPSLHLSVKGAGGHFGVTSVAAVHSVDRRTAIALEAKERADAIHDLQDTNSPAGKPTGLT